MVAQTRRISPGSGLNVDTAMPCARPVRPAWSEPSPQVRSPTSSLYAASCSTETTSSAVSTKARAAGEWYRSRCSAIEIMRGGTRFPSSITVIRGSEASTVSRGMTALPMPAAISHCSVPLSSVRKVNFGSQPAARQAGAGGLECPDAQDSGFAIAERVQVGLRSLEARNDRVCVAQEQVAGLGQRHGAGPARALDELLADDLLEHLDLLADRRLRVAELCG